MTSGTRKLANVRLSQAAVGERSGRSKLYVSDHLNVDHHTYATEGDSRRIVPIDIMALDDYFKPGQRVDLIKMDIQGYKLHALRGGQRVLEETPTSTFCLSFGLLDWSRAGVGWEGLVEMLQALNMNLTLVTTHGLVPFSQNDVSGIPRQNRLSDYRRVSAQNYRHWIRRIDWFGNCKAFRKRGGACCWDRQRHARTILWRRSIDEQDA